MKAGLKRIAIIPDGWIFVASTRDEADLEALMARQLAVIKEMAQPMRAAFWLVSRKTIETI